VVELHLLGPLRLSASDGRDVETVARQSKRAALLAYLAAAVPRGLHRREHLLTLFWPESDATHARAALSQAIYVLRTAVGEHAIVTQGDGEVGLDPQHVWCDATAFEAALDAGDPATAMELYRGDLLDGFFVDGAPEFERWTDAERARLRQRAADGAWGLAEAAAAEGNAVEAGRWARRAGDFLPDDEAVIRRLMVFLDRLGDRAAAIRAYEAFAWRLTQEFELQPSAETQALAASIREDPRQSQAAAVAAPRVPSAGAALHRRLTLQRLPVPVILILMGLAALGLWLRQPSREPADAAAIPRMVVLPFRNLGPLEEEYFVDGITDEITARLAEISGLRVISRTSAALYKDRRTPLRQIGEELSVAYVLDGTIRTERSPSGTGEVRVTPQLIRVADDVHLWADGYTIRLAPGEIFRVQADIAQRVAQALGVTLLELEQQGLNARPTDNLAAYDYYLRGNDYYGRGFNQQDMRIAVDMYQRAVTADSTFALAHARLGQTHVELYWFFYDRSARRLADARRAVDRALQLDRDLPEAHIALGYYHYWGRLDFDRALGEFRAARRLHHGNREALEAMAQVRRRQGRFQEAVDDLEQALALDPRSQRIALQLGQTWSLVGNAAQAERYYDRTLSVAPEFAEAYWNKARLLLNAGANSQKARAALQSAPAADPSIIYYSTLVDVFEHRYEDALRRLASMAAGAWEAQWHFIPASQLRAQISGLMGHEDQRRARFDSARALAEQRVRAQPDEANFHSALGIAYAGLGRKAAAIDEARRAVALLPLSRDAWRGLYRLEDLARVYVMVGEYDAALDTLERLLSLPGGRSIPFLKLDPTWDPLRNRPQFAALLGTPDG